MIEVFLPELAKLIVGARRSLYVTWAPPRRDGEWRLLVSAQVSVTWEVTRLLVSVTTWIRGVCQHIDTTEKIRLSLAHSFLSSTYFHTIIHVLDLRDHNLALPCLVSYLVVFFIACVVCLVSRLVNWALLVLHRLRLLYFVLEIWKRPNSPPLLVHRSLQLVSEPRCSFGSLGFTA